MSDQVGHSDEPPTEDLEDLYETAPCGYLSLRPDGRIFKVNATLANWIGLRPDEIVGRRLHELLSVGTRILFETNVAPALRLQGFFDEASLDLVTAGNGRLPVFANAVERRDAAGRHLFTRLTISKAAERRRYERQIVGARDAAVEARTRSETQEALTQDLLRAERETSELREQFIAVLGHDLRNPLASIQGGTNLLGKEVASERATLILSMMKGSVVRMSALIDNVLDFARGRLGGGVGLTRNPEVMVAPILEQVVAELLAGGTSHVIESDIDLPVPIDCDATRIGQLVSNLLGNAVTHGSSDRPVRIHASFVEGALELWVSNGGNPIPQQAMERLFQPFFRGEVRPSQQGLGLGLHIASEIAHAHGGTLTVTSDDEETRFTFRLPIVSTSTC